MGEDNMSREQRFANDVFASWREATGDQVIVTTDRECLEAIRGSIESNPAWRQSEILNEKTIRKLAERNGFWTVKTRNFSRYWGETKRLVKTRYTLTTDPSLVDLPPAEIVKRHPDLDSPVGLAREIMNDRAI
jgi:hypothetical protein